MRYLHPLIVSYMRRRGFSWVKFCANTTAKHVKERNKIWLEMWRKSIPLADIASQSKREKRYVGMVIKKLRTETETVREKPEKKEKIHPYIFVLALRAISKTDPKYTEKAEKLITKLAEYYEKENN